MNVNFLKIKKKGREGGKGKEKRVKCALTPYEVGKAREAFELYDRDGSGTVDVYELRHALEAVGQKPDERSLIALIRSVDKNGSQLLEFDEFLDLVSRHKEPTIVRKPDSDILDVFVAMGGRYDKTGEISTQRLSEYFVSFGLNIDIDKLVADIDKDQSGYIDFDEFSELLRRA